MGQEAVDAKSNEITAVPILLEKLAIKGCLVTADAMSCQKKIAKQIIKQEADYLLAAKKNQLTLHRAAEAHFVPGKPIFETWGAKTVAAVQYDREVGQTKRLWLE